MLSLVASLDSGTRRRLGQSSEYDGTVAARPRGRWVLAMYVSASDSVWSRFWPVSMDTGPHGDCQPDQSPTSPANSVLTAAVEPYQSWQLRYYPGSANDFGSSGSQECRDRSSPRMFHEHAPVLLSVPRRLERKRMRTAYVTSWNARYGSIL